MEASPEEISALADKLSQLGKEIAATKDPMSRKVQTSNLVLEAKKMIWQIQDPVEAMMDQLTTSFAMAASLALLELNVFDIIPPTGTMTVKEVAEKANCDEELITRLMRQVTCINIFSEPSLGVYSHNRLSIGISTHITSNGKYFMLVVYDEMLPPMLRLNRYIRTLGPRTMLSTYTSTPHSWYSNLLGSNFWEVLSSEPFRIANFSRGLSMFAAMNPVVAIYPFSTSLQPNPQPPRPLMVDVGGGRGSALLALRSACPHLTGTLILQDRPAVLDDIPSTELPDITKMPHDFFTPQPVHGAQVYYIRRTLHDWQDSDAIKILSNIKPAMANDSRILVSDMVLPEPTGPRDAGAIWMDTMMLSIGGKERTERDWRALGEGAGLVTRKVWTERDRWGPLGVVEYVLVENTLGSIEEEVERAKRAEGEKTVGEVGNQVVNGEQGEVSAVDGAADAVMAEGSAGAAAAAASVPGGLELRGDEDWEERTVVGDREGSIDPGART